MDILLSNKVLNEGPRNKESTLHYTLQGILTLCIKERPASGETDGVHPFAWRPLVGIFFLSRRHATTRAPPAYGLTGRLDRRYKMSLFIVSFHAQAHSVCSIGEQPSTQRRARVAELADARDLGSRG